MSASVLQKFHASFRWNISGSMLFEALKLGHNALLLSILAPELYGAMGSIFAVIYFSSRLIESGAAYTVPPFFKTITSSKEAFKKYFLGYFLLSILPIGIIISSMSIWFYTSKFSHNIILILLPTLMILEAVRSTLRQFLHTAFNNRQAIFSELALFLSYLAIVWGGYFVFSMNISLNYLFIPYLIDSIIAVGIFLFWAHKLYLTLPRVSEPLAISLKNYVHIRSFNFLLKVSRDLFTSNFITPLFAIKFGLVEAGVFYFAGMIAGGAQAIIKASIGYSGSALLANLKDSPLSEKQEAFRALSKKLMLIIVPLILIVGINYQQILELGCSTGLPQATMSFALLYLLISFSEYFFLLYEQFYLVEGASSRLFFFKSFEFTLLFMVVSSGNAATPITMLMQIIGIRLISFAAIAISAYAKWRITPNFRIRPVYIFISLGVAALFKFLN